MSGRRVSRTKRRPSPAEVVAKQIRVREGNALSGMMRTVMYYVRKGRLTDREVGMFGTALRTADKTFNEHRRDMRRSERGRMRLQLAQAHRLHGRMTAMAKDPDKKSDEKSDAPTSPLARLAPTAPTAPSRPAGRAAPARAASRPAASAPSTTSRVASRARTAAKRGGRHAGRRSGGVRKAGRVARQARRRGRR